MVVFNIRCMAQKHLGNVTIVKWGIKYPILPEGETNVQKYSLIFMKYFPFEFISHVHHTNHLSTGKTVNEKIWLLNNCFSTREWKPQTTPLILTIQLLVKNLYPKKIKSRPRRARLQETNKKKSNQRWQTLPQDLFCVVYFVWHLCTHVM